MAEAAIAPAPGPDVPQLAGNDVINEAFSDLDQFATTTQDAEKPLNEQPPAPVRGTDGKFQKKEAAIAPATPETPKPAEVPDKPAEKPVEKPVNKPVEVKADPKPGDKQPVTAPELRKAYETLKAEHAILKKEHETFKTAKPVEDPEKKQLSEKVASYEKRLAQLDETLRFTNYEKSEEYKSKYLQPFHDAFAAARKKVASLDVVERSQEVEDPNTGEKTAKIMQKGRPATENDFDQLCSIPDDRQARQYAKQMFGEDAAIAMNHREKVLELNETRQKALDEYQKTGAEREKQHAELTAKQRAELSSAWEQTNKAALEKFPAWFAPIAGDVEGNDLLEKGMAMADRAFGDTSKIPPGDLVKLHAAIRNRAAGFGRQVLLNKRLSAKVTELEKQLKEIQESAPGAGEGGPAKKDDDMENYGENALSRYAHQA